ncbi:MULTISPECIES: DUF397 domain-containing protein [unclassified Streptomyces]|uniref:DUF397 domain-containing protein n=1 Tax=Streptomyces sp. NBC_00060 TaxID=2975636 RepID=A0AAU2H5Y5_9ACTN
MGSRNSELADARWRKSSYSGDQGGDCVELAALPHTVAVRDSKNPHGPAIRFDPAAFSDFVRQL